MSPNGKTMAIFTVIVLAARLFATVDCAPHRRSHLRTLRLCSKRLSDALYLVCSERGYNEPFSYSSEDEVQAAPRAPNGPGLVEECCYHSCSYIQLEQYCKANSEEKRATNSHDVIEESVRIVKLSRTFVRRARSTDERRSKCISDITERERPTARIQPVGLLNDRPS